MRAIYKDYYKRVVINKENGKIKAIGREVVITSNIGNITAYYDSKTKYFTEAVTGQICTPRSFTFSAGCEWLTSNIELLIKAQKRALCYLQPLNDLQELQTAEGGSVNNGNEQAR